MKQAVLGILLLLVCVVRAAAADGYEAIIAGATGGCHFEVMGYEAEWLVPRSLAPGQAVAAAPNGEVRTAIWTDTGFFLADIRPGGFEERVSVTVPGRQAFAIVADRAGNTYALATRDSTDAAIIAFDVSGNVRATWELGSGYVEGFSGVVPGTDLAADQCTLFLEADGVIRRFNVCTGAFLADFITLSNPEGRVHPLRVLPDGGLLVGRVYGVERYSAAGALVRTYPVFSLGAMALVRNGGAVWIAPRCRYELVEVDLETGATRSIAQPDIFMPFSMVAYLGWTAALGTSHTATVPTASELALAFLAISLALTAFLRMRP